MDEQKPNATPVSNGFDLNRPTIVALLYVSSFLIGITGIIGVVLAYVWKGEPHEPWEETHYTWLIRTFWIAFIGSVIGIFLTIITFGIGIILTGPFLLLLAVWALVRTILSLVNAQKRAPMPNPQSMMF